MQQLKQALIKAGVLPKDIDEKLGVKRPKESRTPKKELKRFHEHQIKTICEHCDNPTPDVEYYRHNNKLLTKRWLCIKCADEFKISDEVRETNQSSYSKTGRFTRMWGKTKKFDR